MHSESVKKKEYSGRVIKYGGKRGGSIWEYHLYIPPSMLILGPLNGHRIRFGPQHFFFSAHVRNCEIAGGVGRVHQIKSVIRFVRAKMM